MSIKAIRRTEILFGGNDHCDQGAFDYSLTDGKIMGRYLDKLDEPKFIDFR